MMIYDEKQTLFLFLLFILYIILKFANAKKNRKSYDAWITYYFLINKTLF